ncbi:MAG: ATP-binding protein [Azoarcus sp.]|nr:ATP-binding protein [Azoarcus sp.]
MSLPDFSLRVRRLAAATAISLVAIVGVMFAHLWQMRGEIEREGRAQLSSVAAFLAFEANRQLLVARLMGEEAINAWRQGGDANEARNRVDAVFAHALRNDPVLRELALVDSDGLVLVGSRPALQGQYLTEQDVPGAAGRDGVHIGQARSGRSLMPGAARVEGNPVRDGFFTLHVSQGDLRVVIVLGATSVLNHFGRLTNDDGSGTVRVHRYDGVMLASDGGETGITSPIFRDFLPHREQGRFIDVGADGRIHYAHFFTLADLPIVVEYRRPESALLASWHKELVSSLLSLAVVLIIVLLFSFAVYRNLRQLDMTVRSSAAAEHRFRMLFEYSTEAHLLIEDGCISDCNPAALRMIGASGREALVGHPPADFLPPTQTDGRVAEEMVRALLSAPIRADGVPMQIELLTVDGRRIVTEVQLASIQLDNRSGRLIALRDVTAQLEYEAELTSARDTAQAAARAKASFLAIMSHELRTPMNGILGMADLLADSRLDPEQREHLATLRGSGQLLLTVLNDVLDFSKIDAGRLELEAIAFSPLLASREVLRSLEPAARENANRLLLDADEGIPEMLGDPTRYRQILFNLVGNAIKFTRDGEVHVRLRMVPEGPDQVRLCCSVEDTGVGIAPEVSARLFTAFEQGDSSTTREFGGTGLGLAICRSLVEAMGGEIGVRSAPGEGACFWFEVVLPLARGEQDVSVEEADPKPEPMPVAAAQSPAFRILVAEDNATNRLLIKAMLGRKGHTVTIAEDGQEALELAELSAFDVILMDIQMPRLDGYGAAAAIRHLPVPRGTVPIIALTADALVEERERALQSGLFQDYLTKPIDWMLLQATLERVALRGVA